MNELKCEQPHTKKKKPKTQPTNKKKLINLIMPSAWVESMQLMNLMRTIYAFPSKQMRFLWNIFQN